MDKILAKIAIELGLQQAQVIATAEMLDEGATIPFISRYRKEKTGSLDEVQVAQIRDRMEQLRELEKRREFILKTIEEQGKLSPELKAKIEKAETMAILEDLYLPYKPKRRTKATIAREAGLEPLAERIYAQNALDVDAEATGFIDTEKGIETIEQALQGARDIIAEWVNESQEVRASLRDLFREHSLVKSKLISGKEVEGEKYKDYFDWEEPVKSIPSHRMLAIRRGEKEMILSVDICPDEELAVLRIEGNVIKAANESAAEVKKAIRDSWKRLLKPSLETEIRIELKQKADLEAVNVFAKNIRELLLSSPLGEKAVLALDPGFRTGCKLVCLDKQGKLLENTTIYPNEPQKDISGASRKVQELCKKWKIEAIAIGNGTAGRETEQFVRSIGLPSSVVIVQVNESGASIYSASEAAREEFADYDLTVRGAVSIGRRLMDPLAELVKIDPKSIGVGQYQHDVDQNLLKKSLDDTVISCVNSVGVEVNTASKQLLSYVSGLGPQLAQNIVEYRQQNGPFKSRSELKKVSRLGDKAFEQAAGFLRIRGSKNPLDSSAVHPERYELVQKMAKDVGLDVLTLMNEPALTKKIPLQKYVSQDVGLPTLQDILSELEKPGRDPRKAFEQFQFDDNVHSPEDLKVGMVLPGIVTNITNFGAFVDIGVHQDGLVHISHLADKFVKDPMEVVKVQQQVKVTVLEVDLNRKRIALSMKTSPFQENTQPKAKPPQVKENVAAKPKEENVFGSLEALKRKFK